MFYKFSLIVLHAKLWNRIFRSSLLFSHMQIGNVLPSYKVVRLGDCALDSETSIIRSSVFTSVGSLFSSLSRLGLWGIINHSFELNPCEWQLSMFWSVSLCQVFLPSQKVKEGSPLPVLSLGFQHTVLTGSFRHPVCRSLPQRIFLGKAEARPQAFQSSKWFHKKHIHAFVQL